MSNDTQVIFTGIQVGPINNRNLTVLKTVTGFEKLFASQVSLASRHSSQKVIV